MRYDMLDKIVKIAFTMLDKNNPKTELNHVYVDSENIVLNDTIFLIAIRHGLDIESDMLLLNDKAKYKYPNQKYSDVFQCNYIENGFKYPEYKRILQNKPSKELIKKGVSLLEGVYFTQFNNNLAISIDVLNRLKKLDKIVKIDEYSYRENDLPIELHGCINDMDVTVAVMPFTFLKDQ